MLQWFQKDFGTKNAMLDFIEQHLPTHFEKKKKDEKSEKKSIFSRYDIRWNEFDWELRVILSHLEEIFPIGHKSESSAPVSPAYVSQKHKHHHKDTQSDVKAEETKEPEKQPIPKQEDAKGKESEASEQEKEAKPNTSVSCTSVTLEAEVNITNSCTPSSASTTGVEILAVDNTAESSGSATE